MKSIEKHLYKLIQMVVIKQFPICRVPWCNHPSTLGHHLFPRARHGTAFNPMAVFSCCDHHHALFHSHREEYMEIARDCLGDEYEELRELSLMTVQFRNEDFIRIKEALNHLLGEQNDRL